MDLLENIQIVFEDEYLLVLDKPPGVVVNNAESVKTPTVQDYLKAKYFLNVPDNPEDDFISRCGIVHRIDKETSGLLLVAKTKEVFIALQALFKTRLIKKTYLCIVHGALVSDSGTINIPIGRLPWNKERFGVVPEGKDSITEYKLLSVSKIKKESYSLVEVYPLTGRTHQIRVHFKYINHPLVGDYLYAGRKVSRNDRLWANRVMLHAQKIIFNHPISGKQLVIESKVPEDMERVINLLGLEY